MYIYITGPYCRKDQMWRCRSEVTQTLTLTYVCVPASCHFPQCVSLQMRQRECSDLSLTLATRVIKHMLHLLLYFFSENSSHPIKIINQSTLTKCIFSKSNNTAKCLFPKEQVITFYNFVWCEGTANTLFQTNRMMAL